MFDLNGYYRNILNRCAECSKLSELEEIEGKKYCARCARVMRQEADWCPLCDPKFNKEGRGQIKGKPCFLCKGEGILEYLQKP